MSANTLRSCPAGRGRTPDRHRSSQGHLIGRHRARSTPGAARDRTPVERARTRSSYRSRVHQAGLSARAALVVRLASRRPLRHRLAVARTAARDCFVAVAIANRLSAPLTEDVARKARRARGSRSAPTSLPYSDSRTRNYRRSRDARRSRRSRGPLSILPCARRAGRCDRRPPRALRKRVVAFMSNNHIAPDLAVEVFILEPDASDALDEPEAVLHEPRRGP